MKPNLTTPWKKLLAELDLAQQAFNASHARLSQSLRAAEAGKKPEQPLGRCLQQHLTATSCLLAMGRAAVNYRRRFMASAKTEVKRRRGPMLSGA
jgi:hypothetical protein